MIVGIVVAFFFTPYLISQLGKEQYGIWSLILSIVAYAAVADLGMKQSIVRYISKYYATEDWKQLNEVFSSSVKIYLYIALIIVVGTVAVTFGFMRYFKIAPDYLVTAQFMMIILGMTEAIRYIYLPFTALGAFHRFDIGTYFQIGILIVQTLGMIALLEMGYGLVAMAMLILILTFISRVWMSAIRAKKYPEVRFSVKAINSEKTTELMSYGVYSFLIVAAWIVIFQTDKIVIGIFMSMEAVAIYSVGAMIVTQIRNSIQAIAIPLVPAISHFEAEKDYGRIMSIYMRAVRYLYYMSTYMAVATIIFGGPFILLWVKKDFSATIIVLKILISAAAIYLPQALANSVLLGISKHKIAFYVLLGEALSNVVLSVILVNYLGIVGVALGIAIPQFIIYTFIYPPVFYKAMGARVKPFYLTAGKSISYAIAIVLPSAYFLSLLIRPESWLRLILDCVIVTIIAGIGFIKFVLTSDDREKFYTKIRSVLYHGKTSSGGRS